MKICVIFPGVRFTSGASRDCFAIVESRKWWVQCTALTCSDNRDRFGVVESRGWWVQCAVISSGASNDLFGVLESCE